MNRRPPSSLHFPSPTHYPPPLEENIPAAHVARKALPRARPPSTLPLQVAVEDPVHVARDLGGLEGCPLVPDPHHREIGRAHVCSSHANISYAVFCLKKTKLTYNKLLPQTVNHRHANENPNKP